MKEAFLATSRVAYAVSRVSREDLPARLLAIAAPPHQHELVIMPQQEPAC